MIEKGPRLFVGSLKNPGHPFGTFIIGEHVSEDEFNVVLRFVVKAYEFPSEQRGQPMQLNFMTDPFFTVDMNTPVPKENLWMGRILDPEGDISIITQVNGFLQTIRAKRSGLVLPQLDMNALNRQKVLNEKR